MTRTPRLVLLGPAEREIALGRLPATIGSGEEADVRLPGLAPRHAVLFEREGEVVVLDSGSPQGTFLAGEPIQEAVLRDQDVLQLGPQGPHLRFRAAERRHRERAEGRRLADARLVRLAQQTSRGFRVMVVALAVLALLGLGAVFAWTQRESRRLRAQVAALRGDVERAEQGRRTLETRVESERRRSEAELGALDRARRDEQRLRQELAEAAAGEVGGLKRELEAAHTRLQTLETERQVAERIISQYGNGVCLLQGSYAFSDEQGRPARLRVRDDGRPERDAAGAMVVDAASEAPVHKVEFYGTGFLVDSSGLILTNRHLAEPWWSDEDAEALQKLGFTPRLVALRAFFPRQQGPFDLQVVGYAEDVDLALVRANLRGLRVPPLPLARDPRGAVPGQPVVVLGYPAGLEAILAKAETSVVKQILEDHGTNSDRLTEALATRGLIRPSTTQGHIGDVTKSDIVFDAATSQGGSGGPVFNKKGEVVAVEYALLSKFGGNSFGIPSAYALELIAAQRRR
ncbi:MAG TPA: trypsin-like peptidase domain-containing protein [Vicinamibacteria bacterium]|nr:trypsin-like peptidase domain-containing protein [Vicinamibacteria bacterium]